MKYKKILLIMVAFVVTLCAAVISVKATAYAFTITEDGEYVLIMWANANDSSATVDGSASKAIKFNFDDGEESVRLGDLTKGSVAFNGKNAFSGWALNVFDTTPAPDDTLLTPDDFRGSGAIGGVEFNKGKVVYPLFNGDPIEEKTYYIKLNPFGGKVNGQDSILLTYKADEFKTVDLTRYVPTRSGYSFCGWSLNDKIVTSIDASYFEGDTYALTVVALYKKDDFDPDGQFFLTLDANGLEAVHMANTTLYDMIFMDSHMPVMNGETATRSIREMKDCINRSTPIIAITADAIAGVREHLMSVGMNDYIVKPIDVEVICGIIRKYLPEEKVEL